MARRLLDERVRVGRRASARARAQPYGAAAERHDLDKPATTVDALRVVALHVVARVHGDAMLRASSSAATAFGCDHVRRELLLATRAD